jgi:DNA mismatch endonuclease (patch repair protein)
MDSKKLLKKLNSLGPPPKSSSKLVTKVMKANVARNTRPEKLMQKTLTEVGLENYKSDWKEVPGTPDIAYPKYKIAIFVHGCFWHMHGYPYHKLSLPKTHRDFWKRKFELNKERDRKKVRILKRLGWKVFVLWECQIKKNPYKYARLIKDYASKTCIR